MIDINGLTQLQIEKLFSDEELNNYIAIEISEFLNQISDDDYNILKSHLSTENENDVMLKLVSFLGNSNVGYFTEDGIRIVELEHFVQIVANIFGKTDYNSRVKKAVDLIADMDTILYDMAQVNELSELGHWFTRTFLKVGFTIGDDKKIAEYTNLTRFKLPLIEKPLDHTEEQAGGYHLESNKVVSNRGEQRQPQNCLDVLNKLQSNAYKLREVSYTEERDLIMKKLESSNWKYPNRSKSKLLQENEEKCDLIMMTTKETYDTMKEREFYFTWQYDFRGRMYSVGYDINLQSTKYKKASLELVNKGL